MKDDAIARSLKVGTAKVGTATVERVRRRWVEEGLERALGRKEQLNRRKRGASPNVWRSTTRPSMAVG